MNRWEGRKKYRNERVEKERRGGQVWTGGRGGRKTGMKGWKRKGEV